MDNALILLVVTVILGFTIGYIWKAKKRGVRCVGCPEGKTCGGKCTGCGGGCCRQ